ncbi:MAG: tetratricopeptide repeat protein [Candidatus Methylomirabilia bacterium]
MAYGLLPGNGFISFDDPEYLTRNRRIAEGLTPGNVVWAFVSIENANWHPLAWLSHMADVSLFGMRPGLHHVANLLLHLMNAFLVFRIFATASGALWPSAMTAALFAVHPLHVESVAWASERKDVLCAFFYLLATAAYLRYVRKPGAGRYLTVVTLATLGLMAKPMAVSLPFALLLFDFWPLGRTRGVSLWRLLLEKVPLLGLAAIAGVLTYIAQSREAISRSFGLFSTLKVTLPNVPLAYLHYLRKTLWPSDLTVFYPHRGHGILLGEIALPLFVILGVCLLAVVFRRRHPWLATGWFWYLAILLPAAGILQAGAQAVADRYTYLPLIGIFVLFSWGIADVLPQFPRRTLLLGVCGGAIVILFAIGTHRQVRYWHDDETLFTRALEITPGNYLAHYFLGQSGLERGDFLLALNHYEAALKERPLEFRTLFSSGTALYALGRYDEALQRFQAYLRIRPQSYEAHYNIGAILCRQHKPEEATPHLEKVLDLRPGQPAAMALLAQCRR